MQYTLGILVIYISRQKNKYTICDPFFIELHTIPNAILSRLVSFKQKKVTYARNIAVIKFNKRTKYVEI